MVMVIVREGTGVDNGALSFMYMYMVLYALESVKRIVRFAR